MGLINMIGAIASNYRRNKKNNLKHKSEDKKIKPDYTGFIPYTKEWKDKHLEWVELGLCSNCGAMSGEELGICDECRWN